MSDPVVTRFAPSPTGALHIGGARTALFNWLLARRHGGTFLLRIEDTDQARSTDAATQAIFRGLAWLGLDHDGDAVSQMARSDRHREVAEALLASGGAYKCFSTPQEIEAFREAARANGESTLFRSPWRNIDPAEHPDAPYVIRIKVPQPSTWTINDSVQGMVTWDGAQLDDMILLRSDGTPTYMHAVVVDDHDMGVTHVVRGDDHLNNAFRQATVYAALGWDLPVFAHIPLILGPDGKKMSKRHGATSVEEYQKMGYPAAGMRNYLTRLGWSHGDLETFTDDQARALFDLDGINKAPARFDFKKLENVCGWHIARMEDAAVVAEIQAFLTSNDAPLLSAAQQDRLQTAMYCLKDRAKTLPDLVEKAHFVLSERPFTPDDKASKALDEVSRGILTDLTPQLQTASWTRDGLEAAVGAVSEARGIKLGKLAPVLRAALSGRTVTPSVFDMMLVIGREETLGRLSDAAGAATEGSVTAP